MINKYAKKENTINNLKAIEVINKYSDELRNIENSEGWYKYTVAIEEILKRNLATAEEVEILNKYEELI